MLWLLLETIWFVPHQRLGTDVDVHSHEAHTLLHHAVQRGPQQGLGHVVLKKSKLDFTYMWHRRQESDLEDNCWTFGLLKKPSRVFSTYLSANQPFQQIRLKKKCQCCDSTFHSNTKGSILQIFSYVAILRSFWKGWDYLKAITSCQIHIPKNKPFHKATVV